MREFRIGVDIGGTFTDVVLLAGEGGNFDRLVVGKTLTTPADPSQGAMNGIRQVLAAQGIAAAGVAQVVHGTTLVANAIIERKGERTGLLVTEGFIDVIDMPELRYDIYDLFLDRPAPIAARRDRREVPERVLADGSIAVPLDLDGAAAAVAELVAQGVTSLAICFLHSYENPAHELAVKRLVAERWPELSVSASADVLPEIREYNRISTTTANAFVKPLMDRYLRRLEGDLRDLGYGGPLHLMLSSGGITSTAVAREHPIRLIESGPAAGSIAAAYVGATVGCQDLLSFDMGGTTAKMCVIDGGEPGRANEFEAARLHRFKVGSGLPIHTPVVHLLEIGAGGGSIAHVDAMGLLKVGPESSSADPGPACYGRGGRQPTVTDADLILGYLDPGHFLGGEMRLDVKGAEQALAEHIAGPLGISVRAAAAGVSEVVNHNMATATRVHIAERGRDPRHYAMVAFGGAGPLHGARVAELLGLPCIIFPRASGALSAFGLLLAPTAFEFRRTHVVRLEEIDWARLRKLHADMEAEGRQVLASAGTGAAEISFSRTAEMRYAGQGFTVPVAVPPGELAPALGPALREAFLAAYRAQYGQTPVGVPIEAVNWQLTMSGPKPVVNLVAGEAARRVERAARKGSRPIYVPARKAMAEAAVYDWYALTPGMQFAGPAVVESRESTAIIAPGSQVRVDEYANLIVDLTGVESQREHVAGRSEDA